jgi:adenosylcobinamide kinase/adenosylcobinamide-phosphate guanylyltransferase
MTDLARSARDSRADVVIVSNELGLGVVPEYPQARLYRDLVGWANQMMAKEADHAYFLISGMALDIKALHINPENL